MTPPLHDKILSCDELATHSLQELQRMKKFYEIKEQELQKKNPMFKLRIWLNKNPNWHLLLWLLDILILVSSMYAMIKISIYAIFVVILATIYMVFVGSAISDTRMQAIDKNKATIDFMIKAHNEKPANKLWKFRRKAQLVYEAIRAKQKVNFSEMLKEIRKTDKKFDKNTLKRILAEDLMDVISTEKGAYSTVGRDLSDTTIYSIKP